MSEQLNAARPWEVNVCVCGVGGQGRGQWRFVEGVLTSLNELHGDLRSGR